MIVDDAGYIAVGFVGSLPGETCGDQRPFAGHTWTSSDGKVWERMKVTDEFKAAMVTKLLVVDRTLVGYGQRIEGDPSGDGLPVAAWTDTLPDITQPGDASDEASVPKHLRRVSPGSCQGMDDAGRRGRSKWQAGVLSGRVRVVSSTHADSR